MLKSFRFYTTNNLSKTIKGRDESEICKIAVTTAQCVDIHKHRESIFYYAEFELNPEIITFLCVISIHIHINSYEL